MQDAKPLLRFCILISCIPHPASMSWLGAWIVTSVIAALDTGTTWSAVINSRIPLRRVVGDYLLVYADMDHADYLTMHETHALDRVATIAVVGMLRLSPDVEDRMDALAAEIETKLTTARLRMAMGGFQH